MPMAVNRRTHSSRLPTRAENVKGVGADGIAQHFACIPMTLPRDGIAYPPSSAEN